MKSIQTIVTALLVFFSATACRTGTPSPTAVKPGLTIRTLSPAPALVNYITLGTDTATDTETITCRRVLIVISGNVRILSDGESQNMGPFDFIRQDAGTRCSCATVDGTAELIDIRITGRDSDDHVERGTGDGSMKTYIEAGTVHNIRELLFCPLGDGVYARIVEAGQGLVSFDRLTPGSTFLVEPGSDRTMVVLSGEGVLSRDGNRGKLYESDVVTFRAGSTASIASPDSSMELLTVATSVPRRYLDTLDRQRLKLRTVILAGARPVLLLDGASSTPRLTTTEGPSWLDGAFYFSNYYRFRGPVGGRDEGGLCIIGTDGLYRVLNNGVQTCGTTPLGNGNLAVCDIVENRVIEMTPEGEIAGVIADSYNGIPLGMPNDCVTDLVGGLYFTDPRVAQSGPKQPGSAVYYVGSDGDIGPVTGWNEFNVPNGCLVSAGGETFYLSCSREATIWMFDIGSDGTLSNKRPFARLIPPAFPHDKDRGRGTADGMTMDREGRIYIATNFGIQVFDRTGEFLGNIWIPVSPAHCVFGGGDMSTLFMTCKDRIYSIETTARGYQWPLGDR